MIYIYKYTIILYDFFFHGRKATTIMRVGRRRRRRRRSGCSSPHRVQRPAQAAATAAIEGRASGGAVGKVDSRARFGGVAHFPAAAADATATAPLRGQCTGQWLQRAHSRSLSFSRGLLFMGYGENLRPNRSGCPEHIDGPPVGHAADPATLSPRPYTGSPRHYTPRPRMPRDPKGQYMDMRIEDFGEPRFIENEKR